MLITRLLPLPPLFHLCLLPSHILPLLPSLFTFFPSFQKETLSDWLGLPVWSGLVLDSKESSCLSLSGAGITGMRPHAWMSFVLSLCPWLNAGDQVQDH